VSLGVGLLLRLENEVVNCAATDLLESLEPGEAGAVITDPPRSIDPLVCRGVARQAARAIRPGGAMVVIDDYLWGRVLCRCGFAWVNDVMVLWGGNRGEHDSLHSRVGWYCRNGLTRSGNEVAIAALSNVVQCWRVPRAERRHPSEKPVGLTNFLVSLLTRHDDLIVDPFCGSGSTLVSAVLCGRRFLGSDTDPRYCELATARAREAELEEVAPVHYYLGGKLAEV
jgi:DNA methylase